MKTLLSTAVKEHISASTYLYLEQKCTEHSYGRGQECESHDDDDDDDDEWIQVEHGGGEQGPAERHQLTVLLCVQKQGEEERGEGKREGEKGGREREREKVPVRLQGVTVKCSEMEETSQI